MNRAPSWIGRSISASTSSTPPTATAAAKGPARPRRSLGRWFALGGGRREKVVLATKLYGRMSEWPNDGRLSARHIRAACDESLRRMQTDHIDLYQMHHVDRTAPWDEIWQAMDTLVQQGKIIYVGSSNFAGWHIAQANERAKARGCLGLVSEQSHYNLLVRTVELEVLPACRDYGVGVIPWSPLSSGLLGGVLSDETDLAPAIAGSARADREAAAAAREVGESVRRAGRRTRRRGAWPGCCIKTASRARSSGRGPWISSREHRCAPSTCRSTSRRSPPSTRSSPAPAAPPPRPTPGRPAWRLRPLGAACRQPALGP